MLLNFRQVPLNSKIGIFNKLYRDGVVKDSFTRTPSSYSSSNVDFYFTDEEDPETNEDKYEYSDLYDEGFDKVRIRNLKLHSPLTQGGLKFFFRLRLLNLFIIKICFMIIL